MLDEGFGQGDPKLRLAQLHDALLRDIRCITALEMHTGRMSYEEAVDFFVREGYQTRSAGELEVRRGTLSPGFLVYTLGKLAILKLAKEFKKTRDGNLSMREFHDTFLRQGMIPIKLIRRKMVGNENDLL